MRSVLTTAGLLSLLLTATAGSAQQSATDLAQALQKKYDSIRDFSADFVQTSSSGVLKRKMTERGTVVIKKPGKMRWEYKKPPEEKLAVSNGVRTYLYVPIDKQVHVTAMPTGDAAPTPMLFLAGKGNLLKDFTPAVVSTPPDLPADTVALKLTPKTPQAEYEWLIVGMDPATHMLRGLLWTDTQGGTNTIVFDRLKENVQPSDSLFEFKIPGGVQVVGDVSAR
jgi:outer membrane lipoprotein carrier protein